MDWNFLIRNKKALSVSTDTRNLPTGCVYFALKGDHFDGNQFAAQALSKGASMAIVSTPEVQRQIAQDYGADRVFLLPDDLRKQGGVRGLQSLAHAWRQTLSIPILAITGTNGKTTTKELTAAVLSTKYSLHYTQGNLNNAIGVPLTLLQINHTHELAIIEMGASHLGDIQELVEIAEPTYGLITNVGHAHLQGFGSFDGVCQTKKELYDYLNTHQGKVFRNIDNPYLARMAGKIDTIPYTTGTMPEGTHLVGAYNAENISAALCVGAYFGIDRETALEAIRHYIPSNHRSQLVHSTQGNTIVIDAYNANPTSMQAAINAFDGTVYILGEMRELGEYSHLAHQNIVNMLAERRAKQVLLVGHEYSLTTSPYPIFEDIEALIAYLKVHPIQGKKILLKGSHSNHMEAALSCL